MQHMDSSYACAKAIKSILEEESDGMDEETIIKLQEKIELFLDTCIDSNEFQAMFQKLLLHPLSTCDDELVETLKDGFQKNQHELKKRSKKLKAFESFSAVSLSEIENQIVKSQEENNKFRKTIDTASNKISILIDQLNDANKQSEFLQKQVDMIDETITEMERCKHGTEDDCLILENELFEKQNSLVQHLKFIDKELEENLNRYQEFLENNQCFNEALEELATCYSHFEESENVILQKYHLAKPEYIAISLATADDIKKLKEEKEELQHDKKKIEGKYEEVEDRNEELVGDVDDLYELNRKLTDENQFLHNQIEEMVIININKIKVTDSSTGNQDEFQDVNKTKQVPNSVKNAGPDIEMKTISDTNANVFDTANIKQLNDINKELSKQNHELKERNEHLASINKKVQAVCKENEDVVEENNILHDEIEELEKLLQKAGNDTVKDTEIEEKYALISTQMQNLTDECIQIKENFNKLKETRQPRIIHIKTLNADIIKLDDSNADSNESETKQLEKALLDEKDWSISLEKSKKNLQSTNAMLSSLCRKIGIDSLEPDVNYSISVKRDNGIQVLNSTGVVLTDKEKDTLKIRRNSIDELYAVNTGQEEEHIIDELTGMLHESYQRCDNMKIKQKLLKDKIEQLSLENQQNSIVMGRVNTVQQNDEEAEHSISNLKVICKLLQDMGVSNLERGVLYAVHFQAETKEGKYFLYVLCV